MFLCPVCHTPLDSGLKTRRCINGHCFDRAAQGGYVNLLPSNRRGSSLPGDSPAMCRARTLFLEKGYYGVLRDTLCDIVTQFPAAALLDAGCGEGYYTAALAKAFHEAGKTVEILGIDLSTAALRHAGRQCPDGEFAVASLFELPLKDGSVDVITHLFAPMCEKEFRRVLSDGGTLVTVKPGAEHLWGLKESLYEKPYPNEEDEIVYDGFQWMGRIIADDEITVQTNEDLRALYQMTPYAWKTAKNAAEQLLSRDTLTTKIEFLIDLYMAV